MYISKTMNISTVASIVVVAIIAIVPVHVIGQGDDDGVAAPSGPYEAVCVINGGPRNRVISGTLTIKQARSNGRVTIVGSVDGLRPLSTHGFHVHQNGDFQNETNQCDSCGPHFNPHQQKHGGPRDRVRHVGDLGNIEADRSGQANVNKIDRVISLVPGETNNIIGRAIVVHSRRDDLGKDGADSLNTGNAGARLGCCIIGIVEPK